MNPELGQKAALLIAFVSTSYKHVSAATAQLDFLFCWISKHVALFGLFDLFCAFFFFFLFPKVLVSSSSACHRHAAFLLVVQS